MKFFNISNIYFFERVPEEYNNDNYYIKVNKEVTRTTSNAKFWGR